MMCVLSVVVELRIQPVSCNPKMFSHNLVEAHDCYGVDMGK